MLKLYPADLCARRKLQSNAQMHNTLNGRANGASTGATEMGTDGTLNIVDGHLA